MAEVIRPWAAAVLTLAVASCTPAPPEAHDPAVVDLPVAAVRARVERSLRLRGLEPIGGPARPGPIEAVGSGPPGRGWAECPALTLADPSRRTNRRARVDATSVATRAVVSTAPEGDGSTRLTVRVDNTGTYINPFTNSPVPQPCPSTGVLERELLTSLQVG